MAVGAARWQDKRGISQRVSDEIVLDRQYETCSSLGRGVAAPERGSVAGSGFARNDKDCRFRGRLLLVHSASIRQSAGRNQNHRRLLRRDGAESDLRTGRFRKNKLPGIDPDHLRPDKSFLRAVARHLLEANRSNTIRRAIHRYWSKLSGRDFLWQ